MRRFLKLVLLTLVLVAVALMSALTAMRVAIHGRETVVPNLSRMSISQAQQTANAQGLSLAVDSQFYSTDIPEGEIVAQAPAAGTRVRRGWRMHAAESLGPQRIAVPEVTGMSEHAAQMSIRQRGLQLGTVATAQFAYATTDRVVAQTPPANARSVESPKVSLLLVVPAEPPAYVMPKLVGRSLADASTAIEQAGLNAPTVHAIAAMSAKVRSGTVIAQSPAPGQKVTAATQIALEITQ